MPDAKGQIKGVAVPHVPWHDEKQAALAERPGRPGPYDMEAASGRYVDLLHPDPADIALEDVAWHLSQICRYTGACARTYSVAEHAVLVAQRLQALGAPLAVQMAGLHHDDAEAYLGDVSRPLKQLIGNYRELEDRMDEAVREALGLLHLPFSDPCVKEADTWALAAEARQLMPSRGKRWISDGLYRPNKWIWPLGWQAKKARRAWLQWHEMLAAQVCEPAAA